MTAGSIIALYEEWRWWWVWVRCRCEEKSSVEGHRGGELCAARALGTKNLIGKKKQCAALRAKPHVSSVLPSLRPMTRSMAAAASRICGVVLWVAGQGCGVRGVSRGDEGVRGCARVLPTLPP